MTRKTLDDDADVEVFMDMQRASDLRYVVSGFSRTRLGLCEGGQYGCRYTLSRAKARPPPFQGFGRKCLNQRRLMAKTAYLPGVWSPNA
jgi:hypothetical protein